MGLLKNWQGIRGIVQLLIIQLVCCLTWFSCFAIAQFDISEGVTGSVNFPTLGITCVGNLEVFLKSLIRGQLELEIGARDVLDFLVSPKLKAINGIENGNGFTTCEDAEDEEDADVVMLSNSTTNWSMKQFMRSNGPFARSTLLQILPCVPVQACTGGQHSCNCVVFCTVEKIAIMLARRMPGTLKLLSNSRCLLPCLTCLINGCHGCNQERLLRVEGPLPAEQSDEGYRLRERESKVVSEILDKISAGSMHGGEPICICIPMQDASSDVWTEVLLRSLRSKDAEGRGARVKVSEALEGYLAGRRGSIEESVEYSIVSFVVPRLTEAFINLVLTFWFGVDGFSSALVARRTVRDYLVDSKGSGLAANAYLTGARCYSNSQVCQLLFFRSNVVNIRSLSYIVACVNIISSLGWAVLIIAIEGRDDNSPPLSMPMVVVIIAGIAIVLGMDAASLPSRSILGYIRFSISATYRWLFNPNDEELFFITMGLTAFALESVCIVCAVAGTMGIKAFGRWLYGVVQMLVWVKWAFGSYLLDQHMHGHISLEFRRESLIYSSAFLVNAILAGVRCTWEPWAWKEHHIFSGKLGFK